MSGECFSTKDSLMEAGPNKGIAETGMKGDAKYDVQNDKFNQLLEYENMVSSAESKCSQLKGQLERIKQLYANQADLVKQAASDRDHAFKTVLNSKPPTAKLDSFILASTSSRESQQKSRLPKMVRQNSTAIGTDTTGAALGTINNILAGITKSIQMPDFFEQIKDLSTKTLKSAQPSRPTSKTTQDHHHQTDPVHGVEDVKINTKPKITAVKSKSNKFKARRSCSKVNSKASSTVMKKSKKLVVKLPEKRPRISDGQLVNKSHIPVIDKRSRKIIRRPRYLSKIPYNPKLTSAANPDLVEIYHNAAVKESKSSDSDVPKKRLAQKEEPKIQEVIAIETIPPLSIDVHEEKIEPNKSVMSTLSRNYEMPTISSRMKQVAKYYMNSFNIKTIPFCPATSTTPSHNIGINIQQVMSMVKTRQPVQQLSPTLAYNIGLAAGKWNTNPLSFLVSSITSKVYSNCPLSRSTINYQHLQEMAKGIPQETIEEADENDDTNSPETESVIITGPSGDVKVSNRKQTVWTMDSDDKKCTCAPHRGIEFQQIINKFNGSVSKSTINRPMIQMKSKVSNKTIASQMLSDNLTACAPLQNKERKLKEVLNKLHDEFEAMTKTYDELSKKAQDGGANDEVNQKLENLDKELNSKEEEIVMVMTLYKEVLALKQQVKSLKERTSRDNISIRSRPLSYNRSNNNTAAGLLSKLLRQIQHFQNHYKRN